MADDFRVVGIFREMTDKERKEAWSQFPADTDLVLPRRTAVNLAFRDPARREQGIAQTVLFVDDIRNVKEVEDKVKALGLGSRSAHDFIERQRLTYLLIFGGMTCVAAVALLVSSLGIANTMLMSVLERRREIGIMKAVGAANWQLQAIFVFEGGLIGLVGGGLGLLLAWSISFPGDGWVRLMVQRDMDIELTGSIFAFPDWIGMTVVLSTVCVTIAAALYPARHAAKVDPVTGTPARLIGSVRLNPSFPWLPSVPLRDRQQFDLLVNGCLLVELEAIRDVLPIHKAQLLSYMRLLNVPLGLLFNFHEVKLVDGISRLILPGANPS